MEAGRGDIREGCVPARGLVEPGIVLDCGGWAGGGMRGVYCDVEFGEDLRGDGENAAQPGTVYIQSTGLLRAYQGQGLGKRIKEWEIEYAKRNGFRRMVTNCRESNAAMISINEKYGFSSIRSTPEYYEDGEATVVMELLLR